jgi:hypothetical protein
MRRNWRAGGSEMCIVYLVDRPHDWWRYTPALIRLARQTGLAVHVLSVVGGMGTGLFSSNMPADDEQPTRTALDTKTFENKHTEILNLIRLTLENAGVAVTASWQPEMPEAAMPDWLHEHAARFLTHPPIGWLEWLLRVSSIRQLERSGVRVVDLEPDAPQFVLQRA